MNIENYIESQYRELLSSSQINAEFLDLYATFEHQRLREILITLHYDLISLFRTMNERLPSNENGAHFWAEPSRSLISRIEITLGLFNALKNTKYAFDIDEYYFDLIKKCRDFLSSSGGSLLPANMPKIDLYYTIPIFKPTASITVINNQNGISFELKQIGNGSYANVYKYRDTFYNRSFVLKRAKKELTDKEIERFKREFEEMKDFSSPYILEVYSYNSEKNEYITEYMDYTLDTYIAKYNDNLSIAQRKGIGQQILRAFDYIHSKGRLHRDISPKNILIKEYDDVVVVKIADFGLVKIPDSTLTTANTEFKGYFNDPSLILDGFDTYNIQHETFALARIIYYVMTGKTNTDKIADSKLQSFVQTGLNADKSKRFQNVGEIIVAFRAI
ncbi:MAG: protein kinase family protein [Christensenellales bacterium]|jgi:tRNA A-37 threonylcarbamoyl transferase component Bud32